MSIDHRCFPQRQSGRSRSSARVPVGRRSARVLVARAAAGSLLAEHYTRAAKTFAASPQAFSLGKILLDPSHPALWAVFAMRRRILGYWKGVTLPAAGFSDVRFLPQADVDTFIIQMASLQAELDDAFSYLGACYEELQEQARGQLGDFILRRATIRPRWPGTSAFLGAGRKRRCPVISNGSCYHYQSIALQVASRWAVKRLAGEQSIARLFV